MTLLDEVLDASGGADRWRRLRRFTAHLSIDGALLARRGRAALAKDIAVEGFPETQSLRLTGCTGSDRRCLCRPEHVAVARLDGRLLAERADPRAALLQVSDGEAWDDPHLVYFCAVSIWHCLALPLLLMRAGVASEELPPWSERGEIRRRLRVIFPHGAPTHCAEQILHLDAAGLLRRVDCEPVGGGGMRVADLCSAHQEFSGLVIPTLRRCLALDASGAIVARPAQIDVEIFDASFA